MSSVDLSLITKLREATGAGVMECRKALLEANGDLSKASNLLKESGLLKIEKRASREALQGLIEAYSHSEGKAASLIEVNCETDFVARTEEFKKLAHDLAMQVAAMSPESVEALLEQEYIRDPSRKVKDLVNEVAAKTGENIKIRRFSRFAIGE